MGPGQRAAVQAATVGGGAAVGRLLGRRGQVGAHRVVHQAGRVAQHQGAQQLRQLTLLYQRPACYA
jgi:hypothetical protein